MDERISNGTLVADDIIVLTHSHSQSQTPPSAALQLHQTLPDIHIPTAAKAHPVKKSFHKTSRGVARKPQKKRRKVNNFHDVSDDITVEDALQVIDDENDEDEDEDEEEPDAIYCVCRKPHSGKWMICCDGCDDWFHGQCVNVQEADGSLVDKYYCQSCHRGGKGTTTWKRKCRLPGCRTAAQTNLYPPSKYCCEQHGIDFFSHKCSSAVLTPDILANLVDVVHDINEFHQLGDHVPSPPLQVAETESQQGASRDISAIDQERLALQTRRVALTMRDKYVSLARERQKRVNNEIRLEPDFNPKTGKDICGFDFALCMDDEEFNTWAASDDIQGMFHTEEIPGRENMCLKKKCDKHRQWVKVALEDVEQEEKNIIEALIRLDLDESRIKAHCNERALESATQLVV